MRTYALIAVVALAVGVTAIGLAQRNPGSAQAGVVATSTASPTPTRTPVPPFPVRFVLDCDPNTAGLQASCTFIEGQRLIDVDAYLVNNGSASVGVAAFGLTVDDPDTNRVSPLVFSNQHEDGNPDADQSSFPMGIACNPPQANTSGTAGIAVSTLNCALAPGTTLPGSSSLRLATIHYRIPATAQPGSVTLTVDAQSVFVESRGFEQHFCDYFDNLEACQGAAIEIVPAPAGSTPTSTWTATSTPAATSTPTATATSAASRSTTLIIYPAVPNFVALDCDVSTPGIQTSCSYPLGTDKLDIAWVYVNASGTAESFSGIGASFTNRDRSRLQPLVGVDNNLSGNPDLNEEPLIAPFICSPPPRTDTGSGGSTMSVSVITCSTGAPVRPFIASGSTFVLATMHYAVESAATDGTINITLDESSLYDDRFSEVGSCRPVVSFEMPCLGTTIVLGNPPPTATPTATVTATSTLPPTNTPVPTATNTPTPTATSAPVSTPVVASTRAATTTASVPGTRVATTTRIAATATATPTAASAARLPRSTPTPIASTCQRPARGFRRWLDWRRHVRCVVEARRRH